MCNRLLVWARAHVFAQLNDMPIYTHGWKNFRLGPWLRRERTKRYYGSFFSAKTCKIKYFFANENSITVEPNIEKLEKTNASNTFVFNKLASREDYFESLRCYRSIVQEGFLKMVSTEILNQVEDYKVFTVGIHIRLGDFKIGNIDTNLSYYKNISTQLNAQYNSKINLVVFSDGRQGELAEILALPNTTLYQSGNDLVDLIQLSKCNMIVVAPLSTYSYWAGFISEAAIILPEDYMNGQIRSEDTSLFEGTIDDYLESLQEVHLTNNEN